MAKTLPYFNFTPQDWQNGDIGIEDYAVKGMFIDVCCFYWLRCCSVTRIMLDKKFSNDTARIDYLISIGIIKENKDNGTISITFLDKHLKETTGKIEARREAGRIGGLAKASNAKNLLLAKASNKNREDKNREDDSKKTILKKAEDLFPPEPKLPDPPKPEPKTFKQWSEQELKAEVIKVNKNRLSETGIDSFVGYWSETSDKGKMRLHDQKYFDVTRRIGTWNKGSKSSFGKSDKPLCEAAIRGAKRYGKVDAVC